MKNASKKPKLVLDTKPIIKLFAQEEGWEKVAAIMSRIEAGEIDAGISVVTLTEVYYKYLREKRLDLATIRTDQLRYAIYIKKLAIDDAIAIKAGEFKGKYNVPVADAYIAASAYSWDATLVSDDLDFKKIKDIETLTETDTCRRLEIG